MPPREPRALLEDALAQIDDLLRKTVEHTLPDLLSSRDLQAIFERRFEVLGEALRRLKLEDPKTFQRVKCAQQAIDMRNFIAHGYDGVDHRIVWSTAVDDLPPMRESINGLLREGE